jgi:hypothetical protein
MHSTSCARCGAKLELGIAHACAGNDYQIPVALELLAELKRIRIALEGKDTPKEADVPEIAKPEHAPSKASKREKR